MTREEAIETLKANYPDACYEQLREAVDAAIDALKAQDVAGDTIYRQTAIDAMYKILHDYFWTDDEELDAIIATLNDLPSVQPEPLKITIDPPTVDELERIKHAMRNTPVMLLPSAQPEIIRCKDCRWNDGVAYCEMHFRDVKGDDFCSWAERRTDEQTD